MKNIPKRISLIIGTDNCEDFKELREVTWSEDRVYDSDLQFVSIYFLREKLESLKDERLDFKKNSSPQTDFLLRQHIKFLNNLLMEIHLTL